MKGKFLFLGTSASAGVPVIGCKCKVCTSDSSHNKRLRPSGYLEARGKKLLIDVGPDFRQQALKFGIDHPDGLLLTHTHYDHIAGIDELRIFYVRSKKPFPCLLSKESLDELKIRYHYLFRLVSETPTLAAQLQYQVLEGERGETEFLGVPIRYFSYRQIGMKVNGFRIGDFAYVTDIRDFDDSVYSELEGVRKLVLGALRFEPSPFHFSIEEAIAFSDRVGAEETRLTHVSHNVEHTAVNQKLPPHIQLGFDGYQMDFTC